jgi:hypothetical protein
MVLGVCRSADRKHRTPSNVSLFRPAATFSRVAGEGLQHPLRGNLVPVRKKNRLRYAAAVSPTMGRGILIPFSHLWEKVARSDG